MTNICYIKTSASPPTGTDRWFEARILYTAKNSITVILYYTWFNSVFVYDILACYPKYAGADLRDNARRSLFREQND